MLCTSWHGPVLSWAGWTPLHEAAETRLALFQALHFKKNSEFLHSLAQSLQVNRALFKKDYMTHDFRRNCSGFRSH